MGSPGLVYMSTAATAQSTRSTSAGVLLTPASFGVAKVAVSCAREESRYGIRSTTFTDTQIRKVPIRTAGGKVRSRSRTVAPFTPAASLIRKRPATGTVRYAPRYEYLTTLNPI